MPFHFLCPQGHLLQAEVSQVGGQCRCPTCLTACLIPWPYTPASPPISKTPGAHAAVASQLPLVHIPCPEGHLLETPSEMLGEEALCPFCHAQFSLLWESSLEYKNQRLKQSERDKERRARRWLYGAIAAWAVLVTLITLLLLRP
jgi:hypothetical protein